MCLIPVFRNLRIDFDSHSHDQIKMFKNRAEYIENELGLWAVDYYVSKCTDRFLLGKEEAHSILEVLEDDERVYLRNKIRRIRVPQTVELRVSETSAITSKLQVLIDFLSGEEVIGFTGLIFVKTRAEVAVISHLLSIHPRTRKFGTGTFVGSSSFAGRKYKIAELVEVRNQKTTLDDLREGRTNLVITTNALEEGIDVVSCNVVICFDKPHNLRSFIQRRGRARDPTSRYVLLHEYGTDTQASAEWQLLERDMREAYQDRSRELEKYEAVEEDDDRVFAIESTG